MSKDELVQFLDQKYINLETYKKNGQPVRTPVWFVEEKGVFYVRTDKRSGKVMRVRNNPHVRLVPCDIRGQVKGAWIDGEAKVSNTIDSRNAHELLNQKYGVRGRLLGIMYKFRKIEFVVISISLRTSVK
jgi:PPOX class probable F420-dependent enzyme